MTVYFTNHCKRMIILNIDDGESIFLQPFETKSICRKDSDVIKILAKCDCESAKKSSIYHLVIETEYLFSGVSDGATVAITREKIRFSLRASYSRLFLRATNTNCLSETHRVVAEDKIKKMFNKSLRNDFIFDSLMASLKLILVLLLVGISLTSIWGWRIAVIYFPLAALFVCTLNWLNNKLCRRIEKKAFKIEDEKTEFYNFFENDFIKNYYSDMNRTPFMGKIEDD